MPMMPTNVRLQSRSPNQMSRKTPIPLPINPGSTQPNPSEIHRPRLPAALMIRTQETPTWIGMT